MVQGREAGSLNLRNSGFTLHGSAPPQCDGRTITRLATANKIWRAKFLAARRAVAQLGHTTVGLLHALEMRRGY
jgi:hypothetical protein